MCPRPLPPPPLLLSPDAPTQGAPASGGRVVLLSYSWCIVLLGCLATGRLLALPADATLLPEPALQGSLEANAATCQYPGSHADRRKGIADAPAGY